MVALRRAGIPVGKYFASEKDSYAIKVSSQNWRNSIIQMGQIEGWESWDLPNIDLIAGGSPCQGFSSAGKGLNFDDPRSKLFFVFVDILKSLRRRNKKIKFLLENVKMKQEWQNIISDILEVAPVEINSALVSAQNRKRLYWTNIPGIEQPKDKGILLKDIVFKDALPIALHNVYHGFGEKDNRVFTEKSPTLRTPKGGGHIPSLLLSEAALSYMNRNVSGGRTHWDFGHHSDVRNPKSAMVVANFFKGVPYNVLVDNNCVRHFDPIECERLQTLTDNYTFGASKTQRYKMIGNAWTVDVIVGFLQKLK
jgi:DNA (cytosine-5)-methyltransferase 3A